MQPFNHCKYLLEKLNNQRERGYLCDCTVVIGRSQFKAHKNVLAAFSEYFAALSGVPTVSSITFLDPTLVTEHVFQNLLDFLYTGDIDINGCNVAQILQSATYLRIESLLARCKGFLETPPITEAKPQPDETVPVTDGPVTAVEHSDVSDAGSDVVPLPIEPIETSAEDEVQENQAPAEKEKMLCEASPEVKRTKRVRKPRNKHGSDYQLCKKVCAEEEISQNESSSKSLEDVSNEYRKTADLAVQGVEADSEPVGSAKNHSDKEVVIQKSKGKKNKSGKNLIMKENCAAESASAEEYGTLDFSKEELIRDMRLKMKPICNACGKVFSEASSLRRHMRIHKGVKPHVCQLCGKAFTQCNQLKTHVRTHTGEKPYHCDVCDKAFAQKCQLVFHSRMHHGEEKPYKCDFCSLQFATSSNLKIHSRKHSGEKPYVCDRCGQRFAQASTLTYHVRRHTGEKPYICDTCGKSFAVSSSLITHSRKHTGEKPYKCATCGKSFISSGELNKHSRSHTGEKPFACELCGNSYTDVKNLKKHKSKAHSVERNESGNVSSGAVSEGDTREKAASQDSTELKAEDIPLALSLPVANEDHQLLLTTADGSTISSDQLLRTTVTASYSESHFIFLQQLY
ncbi:myoneurin-like isoform X1 [Polypterus senegalus]